MYILIKLISTSLLKFEDHTLTHTSIYIVSSNHISKVVDNNVLIIVLKRYQKTRLGFSSEILIIVHLSSSPFTQYYSEGICI